MVLPLDKVPPCYTSGKSLRVIETADSAFLGCYHRCIGGKNLRVIETNGLVATCTYRHKGYIGGKSLRVIETSTILILLSYKF